MKSLVRRHPVLTTCFLLAAAFTIFFSIRAVLFAVYWADPDLATHPVEEWMTPHYIVRTYHLQPEDVSASLGLVMHESRRDPLAEIARERGIPVSDLIARIEALRHKVAE